MSKHSSAIMIVISVLIIAFAIVGMIFIRDRQINTDITRDTTRVGLVVTGSIEDDNFCQLQYEAISALEDELNLKVIVKENTPEDDTCYEAIKELIKNDGCRIVIAASFGYGESALKAADEFPDSVIIHTYGVESAPNLSSCQGRMYQARYLSGIVAGMRTDTDAIGYVASFPVSEVNRQINAFALGVRKVRPDANVYVRFFNSWVDDALAREATESLLDDHPDIDVITLHTNAMTPNDVADERGIWSIGINRDNEDRYPDSYLTACVWEWGNYYREAILDCLQGKFHGEMVWLGMEDGILGLSPLTDNVAPGTEEAVEEAKALLDSRTFDVFYGEIKDNNGQIRVPAGESMSDDEMLEHFDWYVEGVIIEDQ